MNPLELFNAGKLDEAIAAAEQSVRSAPSEAAPRVVLAELLCFRGEFERADQQLDSAGTLAPEHAVGIAQFRQIVRSEVARNDFASAGRVPKLLTDPGRHLHLRLESVALLRSGDLEGALAKLEEAEAVRPHVAGKCDGAAFDDLRDADDLVGGVLEVLSGDGHYYWVSFETIQMLEFQPPQRPRDLLFRQAQLTLRGQGGGGVVFVPVLYVGSHAAEKLPLKLGRETDWRGGEGEAVRGVGQRIWVVGEEGKAILDVRELHFD